jgi:hypothetical protein
VSAVARSLDDLDRLAFRLSRTIRTQHPQLLALGFTLSDLEERLLPFREVRREMADGGADAFETALLRLVAGDRDYVMAEPALQSACRQALAFPSPTLSMVRAWATSTLQLNQSARGAAGSGAGVSTETPERHQHNPPTTRSTSCFRHPELARPLPAVGTSRRPWATTRWSMPRRPPLTAVVSATTSCPRGAPLPIVRTAAWT